MRAMLPRGCLEIDIRRQEKFTSLFNYRLVIFNIDQKLSHQHQPQNLSVDVKDATALVRAEVPKGSFMEAFASETLTKKNSQTLY